MPTVFEANQPRGMNERIRRLREQSVATQPRICMERALLETEAYRRYEGRVSVPELRALTFHHIFANKTLVINEGELIVGEKGSGPQAAPSFPELCCHTVQDLRLMDSRELISFRVSESDIRIQEQEIIPFWEERSMRHSLYIAIMDWHSGNILIVKTMR